MSNPNKPDPRKIDPAILATKRGKVASLKKKYEKLKPGPQKVSAFKAWQSAQVELNNYIEKGIK